MERQGRIQNIICRSQFLLPCCTCIAIALWCIPSEYSTKDRLLGFLVCILTAYILMETVNSNSLIRVYTRSVTSFFLLAMGCICCLHVWQPSTIAALCIAGSEYLIFKADERKSPINDTFHVLLLLGVASLFVPQLVVLAPFFYCYIVTMLRSFSLRAFFAGIIGLVLPFGVALGVVYLADMFSLANEWYASLTDLRALHIPVRTEIVSPISVCFIAITMLTLWCCLWFLNNMYRDKLRVRTIYRILYTQALVLFIVVVLQPHLVGVLFATMLVTISPMVGHYFTLSDNWFCTTLFWLTLLLLICVAVVTLLPPDVKNEIMERADSINTLLPNIQR